MTPHPERDGLPQTRSAQVCAGVYSLIVPGPHPSVDLSLRENRQLPSAEGSNLLKDFSISLLPNSTPVSQFPGFPNRP